MLNEQLLRELRTIDDHCEYYVLTLVAGEDGAPFWSTSSVWVGFTEGKPVREIRQASLVKPHVMADLWRDSGQPYIVVGSVEALAVFYAIGGNALIARDIMEREFARLCAPFETAYLAPGTGFRDASRLPSEVFNRAPTPRVRMRILKRDDFRCRLCGRRATDHTDIELHVHHIRPWARGGLTEDDNLITLCSTCHSGLHPHFELNLFTVLKPQLLAKTKDDHLKEHLEGVARYRAQMEKALHDRRESGG